jgi:hypothetical protein
MELWHCIVLAIIAAILAALGCWLFKPKTSSYSPWRRRQSNGYSVWRYQGGRWEMIEDRSKAGYVPGSPPNVPGDFEGDTVQVISVPRP